MHKIIAVLTLIAAEREIRVILLAAVALIPGYVVLAQTSSQVITLRTDGTKAMTHTWLTAIARKVKVIRQTLIALESTHARLALTLTRLLVTAQANRTKRITFAFFTALSRVQVPEGVLTLITPSASDIRLARALSISQIALSTVRSIDMTLTGVTFNIGQCITPEASQTGGTLITCCVLSTSQTLSRFTVTVSDGILINVAITIAPGALVAVEAVVAIFTHVTQVTTRSLWTCQAYNIHGF